MNPYLCLNLFKGMYNNSVVLALCKGSYIIILFLVPLYILGQLSGIYDCKIKKTLTDK